MKNSTRIIIESLNKKILSLVDDQDFPLFDIKESSSTNSFYYYVDGYDFRISDHSKKTVISGRDDVHHYSDEDILFDLEEMINFFFDKGIINQFDFNDLIEVIKEQENIADKRRKSALKAVKTKEDNAFNEYEKAKEFLSSASGQEFLKEKKLIKKDGTLKLNQHSKFCKELKEIFKSTNYHLEKLYRELLDS